MSLLELSGLTVHSGHGTLVRGLDLAIEPGERVGLIGESGSGKSITCLSIMGLLPDSLRATGSLRLAGVDHDLLGADERDLARLRGQRMSMIFQEPMTALNPVMKVGRQVAEIITLHGERDRQRAAQRAVALLDQVGIPDPGVAAQAYPHQLSGGQRQRVMLSMAMANTPDLLLADEPTTALDVTVQAQVLDLMRAQVRDSGSALLFITHDLAVVSGLCERVLIMRNGELVESGPLDRVFSNPQHPYTRALLAASALATDPRTGRLITIPGPEQPHPEPVEGPAAPPHPEPVEGPPAPPHPEPVEGPPAPPQRGAQGAHGRALAKETRTQGAVRHDVFGEDEVPLIFNQVEDAPIVRVRDLDRIYHRGRTSLLGPRREVRALQQVSFDIAAGQRFGIVGESGSGKSTLLRMLSALDSPTAGSVEVSGLQLAGARERDLGRLRDEVQIVFQDPHSSLDPRMRVLDVIAEPLRRGPAAEGQPDAALGRPAGRRSRPIPASVLRRTAAADRDRPRVDHRSADPAGRRGGVRVGRIGARPGAQPARRSGRRLRPDVDLRLPRPERDPTPL